MKPLFTFLLLILVGSCSYLPEEELVLSSDINYQETTEYIKLLPKNKSTKIALIFIPGGLVDPHSYVPIMENVARQGNAVLILKVSANLAILEILKSIKIKDQFPEYTSWYVGGHSLGGTAAQAVVYKKPSEFKGLFFFGVYPAEQYSLANWDKNVISIYAENDGLSSLSEIEANKPYLPQEYNLASPTELDTLPTQQPITLYYKINGGNHSQFGSYGNQKEDGIATISVQNQQALTSEALTQFITWNEKI